MERVDWVFNCLPAALELEVACVRWLHNLVQWHCPRDGNSTPAASVVPSDVADALLSTEDPTGSAKSFWDQLEQSHRMIWATVQETSFWATERQLYRHRLQQQRVRMLNACERALANFSGRL
ncbi:unnamed protein product [Phytomonas sp. Hart1]|nr:unnamed protein product [Phytomonas sp. Hart1]|eukprot:CCW69967.1 unnamed protein product [Phytomonas sp. isolate Hart1]